MLIMTSTDGFCSTIIFDPGELGEVHPGPAPTTISSTVPLSRPSPSTTSNPQFPTPSGRATSPTRSNSSSSVATLSGYASSTPKISQVPPAALSAPSPGSTFIQPTVVSSSHPQSTRNLSISSTGSVAPLGTPPETPNSATGVISLKRDIEVPEQAVVEPSSSEDEPKSKKRRVAPTLISPAESQK
jgi:chromatin assembly factor 1 subunit B